MSPDRAAFSLGFAALLLSSREARADGPRVVVHAPADCAEARALGTSARDPLADRALSLDVTIVPAPGGYLGRLVVFDGGVPGAAREVEGETCREVVDALVLLVGIATDVPPERPRAETPPAASSNAPPAASSPATFHLGAGAAARAMLGSYPAPGSTLFAGWSPDGPEGWTARAGVAGAFGGGTTATTTFAFDMIALGAEACTPDLAGLDVMARPCASIEAGVLAARGHAPRASDAHVVPWVSGATKIDLTWPRATRVRGTLEGGARFAPWRHRYYVGPDSTLYVTPIVGGEVGAFVTVDLR